MISPFPQSSCVVEGQRVLSLRRELLKPSALRNSWLAPVLRSLLVCAGCHVVVTAKTEGLLAVLSSFGRRDPDIEEAVASPNLLSFVSLRTRYLEGVCWAVLGVSPKRRVESAAELFARGV